MTQASRSDILAVDGEEFVSTGMGIDQHGRLFKGTHRMLRAIMPSHVHFYSTIIDQSVIRELIEKRILIATTRSAVPIAGHRLVLQHPLVSRVTFPFEWTANMLRDAALNVLELNARLMEHGYCTQDGHPWNVLFDGPRPVFVDFTSIIQLPSSGLWPAMNEFEQNFLTPLLLMSRGYHTTARALLRDIFSVPDAELAVSVAAKTPTRGPRISRELRRLAGPSFELFGNRFRDLKRRVRRNRTSGSGTIRDVARTNNELKQLDVRPPAAEWSHYYSGCNTLPVFDGTRDTLETAKTATPKHRAITEFLERARPRSLLDVGCNRGVFSQIAEQLGLRAVGIDLDDAALDQMYFDSQRLGTRALPLYVNAVAPWEATGFQEIPFSPVATRLRSECVLCLALVHHLFFRRTRMSFDLIIRTLLRYAEKSLVIEFIPPDDPYLREIYADPPADYCEAEFVSCLSRYFSVVIRLDSFPTPRALFIAEHKIVDL